MAFNTFFTTASLLLLASSSLTAYASDPDIIADFILPQNLTIPDGNFFTSTATRDIFNAPISDTFKATDMFVFPKGLVHYQSNCDGEDPSIALSAFGSSNAGTVSVPASVFTSGIDESVLAKSFKTDVATVEKIKAGLAPKP
ncbi:Germin-like protein 9-3 [Acorus calamus]|uniref:Germin-like protein n=1 Tax=Acorus calamus TaxID=4465 RepID=A0AAV9C0H0_ACOCL|nr:Germin-like protein 9-3 [Acorus calamus]